MKKVFLTLAAVVFAASGVFAQAGSRIWGVKVGANISAETTSHFGYNVGATMDYGITRKASLFTGLELARKGYELSSGPANPLYLQLPIHVGYKFQSGGTYIVPYVGSYLAYSLADNWKNEYYGDYFGEEGIKPLDYGLGFGVGIDCGAYEVKLGYELGLANIARDYWYSASSTNNHNVSVSLSYKF